MGDEEYAELKNQLTETFGLTINEDDIDRNELIESFQIYLDRVKSEISKSIIVRASKFLTKRMIIDRAMDFIDADILTKKKHLIKDENLEKIKAESDKYFALAKQTMLEMRSVVDGEMDYDSIVMELKRLRESVKKHNYEEAFDLVSETLLDLNFVAHPGTDITSVRLAEVYEQLPGHEQGLIDYFVRKNHVKYLKTPEEIARDKKENQKIEEGEER